MRKIDGRKLSIEAQQELRYLGIELKKQGKSYAEIARTMGVSISALNNWWSKYKSEGYDGLKIKKRGIKFGTNRKLSYKQTKKLRSTIITNTPDQLGLNFSLWTRKAIQLLVYKLWKINMPLRTITDYMKCLGFTPQKPIKRAYEQNPKAIDKWLKKAYRSFYLRPSYLFRMLRKVKSFKDFINQVEYFVDIASDYHADFVLFPELFTQALLSAENQKLSPSDSIIQMTGYTDRYVNSMREMAISYNINILGGTHPTMVGKDVKNIAYIFLRGGEVHQQAKIHPTPNERYWWNMKGADDLNVIQTDCGPIGVLICYDAEFPELARHLADQGALLLFVPFCTDERQGYLRVTYCCQARAVENQFYVATSGVVGNLPDVENMDIHYASSHIFTPCDFPFARDGIAASASPNSETIIFADLNMDDLVLARKSGTVQNLKDRRFDLYEVNWLK